MFLVCRHTGEEGEEGQPWGNQRLIQSIQAAHVPDAQVLGAQVLRAGCKQA